MGLGTMKPLSQNLTNSTIAYKNSTAYLKQRLLPLAFIIFLVIGGLTPWLYQKSRLRDSQQEANYMAQSISEGLKQLATQDPILWPYKPQAIYRLVRPFEQMGAHIICQINSGRVIYQSPTQDLDKYQTKMTTSVSVPELGQLAQITFYLAFKASIWPQAHWWVALCIALVISWLLLTIPLRSTRHADRLNQSLLQKILALNVELEQRVVERTVELEQLNQRLYKVQDEERARMSRDLHDELGQTLTGLRLQLTALEHSLKQHNDQNLPDVQNLYSIVDLGIDQVRSIAYAQKPPELDMLSLSDAIQSMVSRLNRETALQIKFSTLLDEAFWKKLDDELSTAIFRVCQEALTNVLRHSSAKRVSINIEHHNNHLILSVKDNGAHINGEIKWGLGLNGVQARVQRLHGHFNIEPLQQGGVHLCVHLPCSL